MSIELKFKYADTEMAVGLPRGASVRSMLPRPSGKIADWKDDLERPSIPRSGPGGLRIRYSPARA